MEKLIDLTTLTMEQLSGIWEVKLPNRTLIYNFTDGQLTISSTIAQPTHSSAKLHISGMGTSLVLDNSVVNVELLTDRFLIIKDGDNPHVLLVKRLVN